MTVLERIIEDYPEAQFLKADGFDAAIVGFDVEEERLVYDSTSVVQVLINEGMDDEDAWDYFFYNIAGAYVGKHTPLFIKMYV
jgi:hypothetical protein